MTIQLSDVLAAAMALTPEDRLRLVDAIAVADDWRIDIVDKPQTMAEAIAEAKPKSLEPANNRKGGKYYKGESLEILRQGYFRYSNQLATPKEKQAIISETARQLGRTYSGIYNQFHKMQNGQSK